jgi:hypothetical protein
MERDDSQDLAVVVLVGGVLSGFGYAAAGSLPR